MALSDKSLMLAVKGGQLDDFGVLFKRHHDPLFSFFYRMTADAPASEDLAQEVFVRMLKYRKTFGEDSDFRGWMYQIARNIRADHFRKHQMESAAQYEVRGESYHPPPQIEKQEQLSMVHQALLALPDDKREILILARYEELKYETIAEMLQIEVGTVKVRVHRALRELRAVFLKMSGEEAKCDVKK